MGGGALEDDIKTKKGEGASLRTERKKSTAFRIPRRCRIGRRGGRGGGLPGGGGAGAKLDQPSPHRRNKRKRSFPLRKEKKKNPLGGLKSVKEDRSFLMAKKQCFIFAHQPGSNRNFRLPLSKEWDEKGGEPARRKERTFDCDVWRKMKVHASTIVRERE